MSAKVLSDVVPQHDIRAPQERASRRIVAPRSGLGVRFPPTLISTEDTDFIMRLTSVSPDGTSRAVVTGGLRARYREGGAEPVWQERERPYRFDFALSPTCQLFPAGHRIRIQVASAALPLFDRNPNSRVNRVSAHALDFQLASQVVLHDAARPSQIRLPLAPSSWAE